MTGRIERDAGASEDNWAFYTHRKLFDMVHAEANGPGAVADAERAWLEFSALMIESRADTEQALAAAGVTWEGLAAEAMAAGTSPLAQWAGDSGEAGVATNTSVRDVGEAFAHTANHMPEPVPVTSTANSDFGGIAAGFVHLLGGQTDQDQQERAAQEAKQRAVELMRAYATVSDAAVGSVGAFVPPQSVAVAPAAPSVAGSAEGVFVGPTGSGRTRSGPAVEPPAPEPRAQARPAAEDRGGVAVPGDRDGTAVADADPVARQPNPGHQGTGSTSASGVVPPGATQSGDLLGRHSAGVARVGDQAPLLGAAERNRSAGGGEPDRGGAGRARGGEAFAGERGEQGRAEHSRGEHSHGEPGRGAPVAGEAQRRGEPAGRGAARGGGLGALPMGGGAGLPAEEDREHVAPAYLHERHDDFWDGDPYVSPPVLGAE
ncbi:PPE domain-containing protein [Actinokineospora iranica]|uniref:PPE family protein n=1 Tax=Actinokineospora iranica TaxID=1271860 RepID=A0A1G6M5W9_9PSEU|nr:PPE domain-containing protein [Actinokineospora iranica]SDC50375.1 PPE family protein [Actinokineospora iranica]